MLCGGAEKRKKAPMMDWDSSVGGSEMWLNSESLGCPFFDWFVYFSGIQLQELLVYF